MVSNEALKKISQRFKLPAPVYVTRPRMPELSAYTRCLEQIWDSRWLTNDGQFHREFERSLKEYLGVEHLNLFVNGKMNEFQASFGLLELDVVDEEIEGRQTLTYLYRRLLSDVPGITCLDDIPGVRHNYSYLPILVDPQIFGMSRDTLSEVLGKCNIYSRKYFHPLCSNYPCYSALPSSAPENLPVANRVADRILCLPLYGELDKDIVETICKIVAESRHAK